MARCVALLVDVETTGLAASDEIIELCAMSVEFDRSNGFGMRAVEQYIGRREPSCPIHPEAEKVHRIARSSLAGQRLDDARVNSMIAGADLLIAYNAPFDQSFVGALYPAAAAKPWHCAMRGVPWKRFGVTSLKLGAVLDRTPNRGSRTSCMSRARSPCPYDHVTPRPRLGRGVLPWSVRSPSIPARAPIGQNMRMASQPRNRPAASWGRSCVSSSC